MAEKIKYGNTLVSSRADETLSYTKYIKDEESGKSVKEQFEEEGSRVNAELDKKFDKANVAQELGDSEEKVVSQAALPFRYIQSEEFIFAQVDAEDHLLFGIQLDGTPVFGKKSAVEEGLQSQVKLLAERVATIMGDDDTTNVIDTMNELKQFFANIESTQKLTDILLKLDTVYNNLNTTMDKVEKTVIKDEEGNVLQTPFKVIDSPEFLHVLVDAEDHILMGIRRDGSVEWAKGIPSPIREKLNEIVNQFQQDKEDLSTKIDEINTSLQAALSTKVDKEEGKSLIDNDVKNCFELIENDEWIHAMVDAENHLLFGIRRDTGKPYFPLNEMYHVEQNEEFFALWLDAEDHILMGIRRDGQIVGEIHAVTALKEVVSSLQSEVEDLKETVSTIDSSLQELLDVFSLQENPEYMAVETDADGRILASTNADGSHYAYNLKSETIPEEFSHIDDPEGRMHIVTDGDGKLMAYRDKNGVQHEHELQVDVLDFEDCNIGETAKTKIKELAGQKGNVEVKKYSLPDYGTVNILQETFYLTANSGYSDKSGIYPIVINEDTQENAKKGLVVLQFFVKSTLTRNQDGSYSKNESSVGLDFYVPSKITYVNEIPYVTSSLRKNDFDGTYAVLENSIKVTKIIDVPTVGAWSVDKKTEHQCIVNIDFGHYLNGTFNIGIKYQGSSTLYNRKRNFRFTFYKDSTFAKKDKIKLGEMVRTSGFNLKANYSDRTRLKEFIMNRILMSVWETRGNYHSYPWDRDDTPYSGATGMIKGFPITVNIGGEFYGLDIFGLKKDEKNYLLDGDDSGMIVSGTRGNSADPDNWTGAKPTDWEDEMNDELTESNKTALESFFTFINSEDFTKENVPSRMSVLDWIDYFICLQVFFMPDNTCRNMILYTGSDKQKFYPFFYDLDLSWGFTESNYSMDIMVKSYAADMSLWENFKNLYWDEIINRYLFLRENVLSEKKIQAVYDSIPTIPKDIESKEKSKWGTCDVSYMQTLINLMDKRLDWLDNNYFKS